MAQHDGVISNASGAAVRADLNNALAALITNSSGATAPATTYAYQWWADTTTGQLKLRNSANSAWITIFELDGTMLMEDGTVSAPGLAFASDLNTGFFRSAADKINFATGGAERLEIGSSEVVFNDPSNDVDFRVESNGNANMLFVDAGNDRVGIGTGSPARSCEIVGGTSGAEAILLQLRSNFAADNTASVLRFGNSTSSDTITGTSEIVGIRGSSGSSLAFKTQSGATLSEAARIDSNGNLGVGLTSLEATGFNKVIRIKSSTSAAGIFAEAPDTSSWLGLYGGTGTGDSAALLYANTGSFRIGSTSVVGTTGFSEKLRIDGDGRLLVGTTSDTAPGAFNAKIQTASTGFDGSISMRRDSNSTGAQSLVFGKSRSSSLNGNTIVQSGDTLGSIVFCGADGTDLNTPAAQIIAAVDGTPGSNVMPGRLIFQTTAGGAASSTERVRIDSSGNVGINTTSPGEKLEIQDGHISVGSSTNTTSTNTLISGYGYVISGSKFGNVSIRSSYVNTTNAAGLEFYVASPTVSEAMRLDSSGRLLVGTSSALTASSAANALVQIVGRKGASTDEGRLAIARGQAATAPLSAGNVIGQVFFTDNAGNEFSTIKCEVDSTSGSGDYPGRLVFSTTADGASSPTERMRIGSDGVVKISKANAGNIFRIESTGANEASMLLQNSTTGTGPGNGLYVGVGGSPTHGYLWNYEDNALVFGTNNSERMRVTNDGFLAIGGSSTVAGAKLGITFSGATQNGIGLQTTYSGTGSDYIRFNNSAGNQAGEITQSGTTSVSYTTTSDYRLKENVVDIADGIDRVKQLAPKRFNFIADEPDRVVDGFIAHEAQTVVPEAVTGTYNEVDDDGNPVYQGIDPSKLVPLLTAALQEAIAKIETLETKVAALEAS